MAQNTFHSKSEQKWQQTINPKFSKKPRHQDPEQIPPRIGYNVQYVHPADNGQRRTFSIVDLSEDGKLAKLECTYRTTLHVPGKDDVFIPTTLMDIVEVGDLQGMSQPEDWHAGIKPSKPTEAE